MRMRLPYQQIPAVRIESAAQVADDNAGRNPGGAHQKCASSGIVFTEALAAFKEKDINQIFRLVAVPPRRQLRRLQGILERLRPEIIKYALDIFLRAS